MWGALAFLMGSIVVMVVAMLAWGGWMRLFKKLPEKTPFQRAIRAALVTETGAQILFASWIGVMTGLLLTELLGAVIGLESEPLMACLKDPSRSSYSKLMWLGACCGGLFFGGWYFLNRREAEKSDPGVLTRGTASSRNP